MAIVMVLREKIEIDTSSPEFREKVSNAVKDYLLANWDYCVEELLWQDNKGFRANLCINL